MRWKNRRSSRNVEDRRSANYARTARGAGSPLIGLLLNTLLRRKGGKKTLVMLAIGGFVLWKMGLIDPAMFLGGQSVQPSQQASAKPRGQDDELAQFVSVVLAETEDVWQALFQANGQRYEDYCPGDNKVYIDLSFYRQLRQRFEAPGDFAQAYVIAHEVGHHVQNLTGVLSSFHKEKQRVSEVEANKMSVRVELQADCYSGIWAHYTNQKGLLESGDLEEALNAAMQIGDDALQQRARGYVVPESFNHGTSKQRMHWFNVGYRSGNIAKCDTFKGSV